MISQPYISNASSCFFLEKCIMEKTHKFIFYSICVRAQYSKSIESAIILFIIFFKIFSNLITFIMCLLWNFQSLLIRFTDFSVVFLVEGSFPATIFDELLISGVIYLKLLKLLLWYQNAQIIILSLVTCFCNTKLKAMHNFWTKTMKI